MTDDSSSHVPQIKNLYAEKYDAAEELYRLERHSEAVYAAKTLLKNETLPRYFQINACIFVSAGTDDWDEAETYLEMAGQIWTVARDAEDPSGEVISSWLMNTRIAMDDLASEQAAACEIDVPEAADLQGGEEDVEGGEEEYLDEDVEDDEESYEEIQRRFDEEYATPYGYESEEALDAALARRIDKMDALKEVAKTLVCSDYHHDVPNKYFL